MSRIERQVLTLEFVTPCFLGGAGLGQTAEWRAASVRGELRWWFRAVAGGLYGGQLDRVRLLETAAFGSTAERSPLLVRALGGPAAVRPDQAIRFGRSLSAAEIASFWKDPSKPTEGRLYLSREGGEVKTPPIHYLGYGPVIGPKVKRPYLPAGETAKLILQWTGRNSPLVAEARSVLDDALWCWINLGGIGARCRKGFGSVRVVSAQAQGSGAAGMRLGSSPATAGEFVDRVKELLGRTRTPATAGLLCEWSHLSGASRVFISTTSFGSWEDVLLHLGAWLIAFRRRYGVDRDSRTYRGVSLAGRDKEWSLSRPGSSGQVEIPERAGFGLPLTFRNGPSVNWGKEKAARRASPLLLHVARFGGADFRAILTYLPARLVPDGELLGMPGTRARKSPPTAGQMSVVDHFLDDLAGAGKRLIVEIIP